MPHTSPEAVVQAQLDAYNAKDIDALLATYAPDAEQYQLHGPLLAAGTEEMRARFLARFVEPDLYANLISRVSMESIVIDHEVVTRNLPEGLGTVEMMCIYEVADGRIQKASFALAAPRLQEQQAP
ncbi:MAG TPA: nuclear transport factor 2 family protein [Telluria sp.]